MYPRIVKNYIDESSVVRTERLKIPYAIYSGNPHNSIRELLGQDIQIKSVKVNSIVTDDECYIIDVEYINIKFNPFEVIFIDVGEVKPMIPNSTVYAARINGCNVKISIQRIADFKSKIPIHISPKLSDNVSAEGQLNDIFSYYGKVVRRPMHDLCTPLKYPGHQATPFKLPPIPKLYPEGYKLKRSYTMEETKDAYKAEASQQSQLKAVDNFVIAKSFDECKFGTTGYIIDYSKIPQDRYLNGIILIQAKRIPNVVLFYPTNVYMLYLEELESIKNFLEMDEINALNYDFVMG